MAYSYKGAISFGLVYIPITLHLSVKENDIGFNMLDKKTMSRVKYIKTCVDCNNKIIDNKDIVKGYQYEKDSYIIVTNEEIEKIKTKKDKNITIDKFVNLKEIDPIFFAKCYYVQPVGAEKAFYLLLQAMEKEKKAGIAKCVLGTKETLLLLRSLNNKMVANTLYFYDEIQKAPAYETKKLDTKELNLAIKLIDNLSGKFNIEEYKDEYQEKLKKAIQNKINGKRIVKTRDDVAEPKIINIMDALKASLKNLPSQKTSKKATKKLKNA